MEAGLDLQVDDGEFPAHLHSGAYTALLALDTVVLPLWQ